MLIEYWRKTDVATNSWLGPLMAKVSRHTTIKRPVAEVFDYLDDPTNAVGTFNGLVEIKNVQSLPNGGTKGVFVRRAAGVQLEGWWEDIEHVPNQRVVQRTANGIGSRIFEPTPSGTKLTFRLEWKARVPVFGRVAEWLFVWQSGRSLQSALASVKARMEGSR